MRYNLPPNKQVANIIPLGNSPKHLMHHGLARGYLISDVFERLARFRLLYQFIVMTSFNYTIWTIVTPGPTGVLLNRRLALVITLLGNEC
jgi:hypothetical protein